MKDIVVAEHKTKDCPFCGYSGYIFRDQLWSNKSYDIVVGHNYFAGCLNPVCKMQPKTKGVDDIYRCSDKAIEIVVNDWNTRR